MASRVPYREKRDAIAAERRDGSARQAISSDVGRVRHRADRIQCADHSGLPASAVGADAWGRDILDRLVQATKGRRDVRRPVWIYREIKLGVLRSDVLHSPSVDRFRRDQQDCVPKWKSRARALGKNHPMPDRARAVSNGEHHPSRQDGTDPPKRLAAYRPRLVRRLSSNLCAALVAPLLSARETRTGGTNV